GATSAPRGAQAPAHGHRVMSWKADAQLSGQEGPAFQTTDDRDRALHDRARQEPPGPDQAEQGGAGAAAQRPRKAEREPRDLEAVSHAPRGTSGERSVAGSEATQGEHAEEVAHSSSRGVRSDVLSTELLYQMERVLRARERGDRYIGDLRQTRQQPGEVVACDVTLD